MDKELAVTDIRVYAPTKDFELSISFYKELGWVCNWSDGKYAEMELGGVRFFYKITTTEVGQIISCST